MPCIGAQRVPSITEWATVGGTVLALFFAFLAWRLSRRSFKREMVDDLFTEYTSREMGTALKSLHDGFKESTKKKVGMEITPDEQRAWIEYYKGRFETEGGLQFHFQRRLVSAFYQKIAFFAWRDRYITRIVKEMWGGGEHSIVMDLILPIETIAIPELLGNEPTPKTQDYPYSMRLTWLFWRRGVNPRFSKMREFVRHCWRAVTSFMARRYVAGGGKMTREEKRLASKIRQCFMSPTLGQEFTREENRIIERWMTLGLLSERAFRNVTTLNLAYTAHMQNPTSYPFTRRGEDETTKGWYMRFRQGKVITIIRDVLTAAAFLVSLYLAISRLFPGRFPPP